MTSDHTGRSPLRYKNPVFPHSFPDPFVLKHNGEYFAYCTGHWSDGRVFGVLRSGDLINWEPLGGAMEPLDDPAPFYWAPELIYSGGTFYLYYSVGNETLMQIRVAVSDRPGGGFRDAGHRLTFQDFAIDAHVFRDDDGSEYLFYATDFLDHTHIGTGIVMDRMLDRFTLAGDPRPVVRAKYDWQVYDPARREKGGVRWHTVEGPFVFKRKGTYFVMFSGGNWQNPTYGVSFATSVSIEKDGEWDQFCDGEKLLPILRTDPGKVIGPGHNSVVRGPNNREMYCVYHSWEHDERVLALNRMDIVGDRLVVEDDPFGEKLLPFAPDPHYTFGSERWRVKPEESTARGLLRTRKLDGLPSSFICEFDFAAGPLSESDTFGFLLEGEAEALGRLIVSASGIDLKYQWQNAHANSRTLPDSRPGILNRLRLEVDHNLIRLWLNGDKVPVNEWLAGHADSLSLFTVGAGVEWSAFALTEGFENGFERDEGRSLDKLGWAVEGQQDSVVFGDGEIRVIATGSEALLSKGRDLEAFEFSTVVRLVSAEAADEHYGFVIMSGGQRLYEFDVTQASSGGQFRLADDSQSISFDLPLWYQSGSLHRFGFTRSEDQLLIDLDLVRIGSVPLSAEKVRVGIRCFKSEIAIESVRLTAILSRSGGGC